MQLSTQRIKAMAQAGKQLAKPLAVHVARRKAVRLALAQQAQQKQR